MAGAMRLGELDPDEIGAQAAGWEVVSDGEFRSLGYAGQSKPEMLTFCTSEPWILAVADNAAVSAVCTTAELADMALAKRPGLGVVAAEDPKGTFYSLHNFLAASGYYATPGETSIHVSARIHPRAWIDERGVVIGPNCVIEANAAVLAGSRLDGGVTVGHASVIGSEGFQWYASAGEMFAVLHAGGVWLKEGVAIHANVCVDRGVFGDLTVLGQQTKIDNLVHVAHGCQLGRRNLVVAGAMIAGSVTSGDDVWFGPMCAVSNGVRVGDGATITIGAVVTRDVPPGARVSGNFAVDHERFLDHMRRVR